MKILMPRLRVYELPRPLPCGCQTSNIMALHGNASVPDDKETYTTQPMKKRLAMYWVVACFALMQLHSHAQVSRLVPVDGPVYASVLNTATGILYIGGNFTAVNAIYTEGGAVLSTATGLPDLGWPVIDGTINACIPDGHGGWYIGGSFTHVGGMPRNNLAHIDAKKSVTGWNPNANSDVYALAVSGGTVYAGGGFTNLSGATGGWPGYVPRYIARLDGFSGTSIPVTSPGTGTTPGVNTTPGNNTLTGMGNTVLDNEIKVYPNPTDGMVHIELWKEENVQVISLEGILLREQTLRKGSNTIQLPAPKGIYIFRIGNRYIRIAIE